ncbi:uncharacterized protein LOC112503802 [Cynara cardunculus var. scolymus]|uniref:uncharacterized protein LOC112503802 n=1 Tax=Cynara cardunculus var. scolymus TaxID=59895 RepID=UPI000D62AD8A|nr:uncharacterized protein LOC112503802 [Cynara cardunculus var. scolymus]
MIRGRPLFVSSWDPSKGLHKPEHTSCPLWIKFFNIPLVAFNREGISRIASAVGIPLRLDACTASTCDKAWGRTNFAKVLVDVWAVGEIQRQIEVVIPRLSGNGEDIIKVVLEYDWVPSQCSKCKVFGHQPRRRHWKPKNNLGPRNGDQATTSGAASKTHLIVGVGTIKQVTEVSHVSGVSKKEKEVVKPAASTGLVGESVEHVEGQYCTVDAGRTPKGRDDHSNVTILSKGGPDLVQAVVHAFKPRQGAISSTSISNRFSSLQSDDSSDDDDIEIIDTEGHSMEQSRGRYSLQTLNDKVRCLEY